MTHRNFLLQKENDCKFQLCFVKCCTLEGYHKLLSPLNRLVRCHFILFRICISKEPAGNIISRKGSVASVDGVGGSEPLRRAFRGWSPLRKFFGSKEYLDWFNDTRKLLLNSVQEFTEIQAWLIMTFFLYLHNQLISTYYIVT